MISRSANSYPSAAASTRPISVPPLPTVSDMATMLIAHLLVNTRTPPRATDVANEGVADNTREPVPPPCGTPHHSDDSPADLSAPILSLSAEHRQARPTGGVPSP